jgi:hypothetical protein
METPVTVITTLPTSIPTTVPTAVPTGRVIIDREDDCCGCDNTTRNVTFTLPREAYGTSITTRYNWPGTMQSAGYVLYRNNVPFMTGILEKANCTASSTCPGVCNATGVLDRFLQPGEYTLVTNSSGICEECAGSGGVTVAGFFASPPLQQPVPQPVILFSNSVNASTCYCCSGLTNNLTFSLGRDVYVTRLQTKINFGDRVIPVRYSIWSGERLVLSGEFTRGECNDTGSCQGVCYGDSTPGRLVPAGSYVIVLEQSLLCTGSCQDSPGYLRLEGYDASVRSPESNQGSSVTGEASAVRKGLEDRIINGIPKQAVSAFLFR